MARCDLCVKFDNCPWRSDPDAMCSAFKQRPMTNGDKIRSMSDEELANKMSGLESFALTCGGGWSPEKWLDWLKEESE